MVQLSIGDEFTLPNVTAFDEEDGNITHLLEVNKTSIDDYHDNTLNKYIFYNKGIHEIIYTVSDSSNNTTTLILTIKVKDEETFIFEGYYEPLNGLSGEALNTALYNLLNDTGQYATTTYGEARDYLSLSDAWTGYNDSYLNLIYSDTVRGTSSQGFPFVSYANPSWDSGSTWNREHVWAKSLFGSGGYDPNNSTRGIDADLHNLRAADTRVNSSRGNNKFIDQIYIGSGFGNYNGMFYPGDNHRGDVARILLYMDIRWGSLTDLSKIADFNTLLAWHEVDPVDDFEIHRNNVIYAHQNNRNPFIDHPELIYLIYSDLIN